MAVRFNGAQANEVFFEEVNLVHFLNNGTEVLPQTVQLYIGQTTDDSGNNLGTGKMNFFSGGNRIPGLIDNVADSDSIPVWGSSDTYGFEFNVSPWASGWSTSAVSVKRLYDSGYTGNYRSVITTSADRAQINVRIRMPFDCTLEKVGYVQADLSSGSTSDYYVTVNSVGVGKSSSSNVIKSATVSSSGKIAGHCTTIKSIGTAFSPSDNLFIILSTASNSKHCLGDICLRFTLSRKDYIDWKNGRYVIRNENDELVYSLNLDRPPVRLDDSASIIRV